MKRLLFVTHRWLGIALGLFMLLWFLSGLVMVYSGSTAVTQRDRLAHAQEIPFRGATDLLSAGKAWQLSQPQRSVLARNIKTSKGSDMHAGQADTTTIPTKQAESRVVEARLMVLNNLAVWQVADERGQRFALSALNGEVQNISSDTALQIAKIWGGAASSPRLLATVEKDLTTRMMMFDSYRPFHKVALGDSSGTELSISSRTGEIVASTTRVERVLAYTGDWLHFFRFLDSVGLGDQRRDILMWTSFVACVSVLTGLIVGWMRWRPGWLGGKTYSNGRQQPYRAAWPRWHFWLGLLGGIITLTWMVSGFLVNNPWEMFSKTRFSQEELLHFQGGSLATEALAMHPETLLAGKTGITELNLHTVGGRDFSLAFDAEGSAHPLLRSETGRDEEKALRDGAQRFLPDAKIKEFVVLADYDDYYYPNHRRRSTERPLPVLRVDFDDAAGHRLYIDPVRGRPLLKIDNSRRIYRWLFYALHNWDLGVLYSRPVWDVWMVLWSLIGLALSVTSLWLGWQRLVMSVKSNRLLSSQTIFQAAGNPRILDPKT